MSELAARKCEACGPGTPPLDAERAAELLEQIDGDWSTDGDAIVREYKFANFTQAFGHAAKVALLAENQGHHPDFELGWGRLKLLLTTHSVGGLSDNDFIMAAKIDKL